MRTILSAVLFLVATVDVHAFAQPSPREGRAQLELAGVLRVGEGAAAMVILREKGSQTILPLLIPGEAGRAAASQLAPNGAPPLMRVTLRALGAKVQEVELLGANDEVESGRARVAQGRKVVDVGGTPPELIALAVATGAPLFIDRHLLAQAGLTPEDIEHAKRRLEARRSEVRL